MFSPVPIYRFSNYLHSKKVPFVPKILSYFLRLVYGCWLPYNLEAGSNLVLGYGGLGVVIHGDATIGANVHIDQNVTIGGNGVESGVPVIGSDVYVGAGAIVLGPIKVGDGSIIGANSVVIKDVKPLSVVAGNPAQIIKENINVNDYLFHKKNKK